MEEIKKQWVCCNDYWQYEYSIRKPIDEVKLEEETEYPRTKESEINKYYEIIKKEVDVETEKILSTYSYIRQRTAIFQVHTKPTTMIEREKRIRKTLESAGFKLYEYSNVICMEQNNWVKIDGIKEISYDKKTMEKLSKVLKASDWEVVFDWHMEHSYLVFKLQNEEK